MRFIAPECLYALAVAVPAVTAALWYAAWRRRRELEALFADPEAARTALRVSPAARAARIVLLGAAIPAAIMAAARPYWKSHPQTVNEHGRDIVVVFDVSKSMLAKDLPPSRLEHAKFLLRQLAQKFPGDRLALVAFAGAAYAACPLTADPVAFEEYVDELTPDLVQRGGTDLEKALREALKCLKGAAGTQAVVLLTDGDELTGSGRRTIDEFKRRGVPVCVVGLGDPEAAAPLPDETGALRRDAAGKLITSRLNEPELRKLAAETGGVYVRSTVADTGAEAVAAHLARLTAAEHGERIRELPEERFEWFVALAALLLTLSLLISERSRRSTARKVLSIMFLLLAAPGVLRADEEPPPAAAPAEDAGIMAAKRPEELYNLGLKRQQAGDAAGARLCYERLLQQPDKAGRARAKALLNLGAERHQTARKAFAEAQKQVAAQQLDPALAKLKAARGELGAAKEFYGAALADAGAAALDADGAAADDLRLREADLKRIEELEKRIEELKKQQRQAQQSARNAQQQNQNQKQQQKQQNQQQSQPQQGQHQQQNQQQSQPQQGQQDQQQSQPQQGQQQQQSSDRREAIRDAAAASEKLQKSAEQLGQDKLKEQARRAAEELRRAEAAPDPKRAQPHLDRAVRELGGDEPKPDGEEQKKSGEQKPGGGEKKEGGQKSGEENKQAAEPVPGEELKKEADRKGTEQLLELLNDGEKRRREELNRRRRFRRPPVEKDW